MPKIAKRKHPLPTSIALDFELRARLKKAAKAQGLSVSEFARRALDIAIIFQETK